MLRSKNCLAFKDFCFNFFSAEAEMKSSVTLTTKSSSLIDNDEDATALDCWNSDDANSLKKSAADFNCGFSSSSSAASATSASASASASIWDSASSPNLVRWDFAVSVLPVLECLSNFLSLPFFLWVDFGAEESLFLLENLAPASLPAGLALPPFDLDGSSLGGTPLFLVDFCGATISFGAMNSSSSPETSLPNNA